jgi:uncharacterized coiled-coil protein SlyX
MENVKEIPAKKEKKPAEVNLEYLKEKMRERAATEVPSAETVQPTKNSSLTTTLEETKEAVEKVSEKLEELTDKVAEEVEHSGQASATTQKRERRG